MSPANETESEPFPSLSPIESSTGPQDALPDPDLRSDIPRHRASTRTRKSRSASLLLNLVQSSPPLGAWQAIGEESNKAPTIPEIKNGSYSVEGWSHEGQLEKRQFSPHDIHNRRLSRASSRSHGSRSTRTATATRTGSDKPQPVAEEQKTPKAEQAPPTSSSTTEAIAPGPDPETGEYPNGYRFPKKHTWTQSVAIYGTAFWKFFWTVKGFLITVYALNVVAWGAMIFFLLIPGATPAMCKSYPDCQDKRYSARQIWIENCSQILTALFCVTAFGLLPWRARDFYYMVRYQVIGDYNALRKLAGFYRGWYRLPGSDKLPELLGPPPKPDDMTVNMFGHVSKDKELDEELELEIAALEANPAVPLPPWSMPEAPLTGVRARPTQFWPLAAMIWMYTWNTLFQVGLCVVMWGFNRFQRNTAYFTAMVALFIVLGCLTGIAAGIVVGRESKVIKEVEGIPVKDYDQPESAEDFQVRMAKKQKKERSKNKQDIDVEKQDK